MLRQVDSLGLTAQQFNRYHWYMTCIVVTHCYLLLYDPAVGNLLCLRWVCLAGNSIQVGVVTYIYYCYHDYVELYFTEWQPTAAAY